MRGTLDTIQHNLHSKAQKKESLALVTNSTFPTQVFHFKMCVLAKIIEKHYLQEMSKSSATVYKVSKFKIFTR